MSALTKSGEPPTVDMKLTAAMAAGENDEDSSILAVKLNARQGLPLSAADRGAARSLGNRLYQKNSAGQLR
ncbi:hypothetical protein [Nocardia sp. NPDC050175]|uniref:hypothetical protein n=1 Tax=Nocardia sp. NPDC050175 TaxID=3364317 RepID=UPI0037A91F07